jgi:hypothetical protein
LNSNDSKIGSAGGIARAQKLSDERKREIARNAARVGRPRATHQGRMALGDLELDCYVLSDGRRVFHKRGMAKALGLKSAGGNAFMKTISRKGVGSNISSKLREKIENPIKFKPLSQEQAHGYEAAVLAEIARAIVDARDSGSQKSFLMHSPRWALSR